MCSRCKWAPMSIFLIGEISALKRRTKMSLFLCLMDKDLGVLYRVSKSVDRECERERELFGVILNQIE